MSTEIDAETLRERLRANSSTPAEDRRACERCGSLRVHVRGTGINGGTYDRDYYCKDCHEPCHGTGTVESYGGDGR